MASMDIRPTGATRVRWRVPGETRFQTVTYADSADAKALAAVVAARGHRVRATDSDVVDFSIVTGVKMAPVTAPVLTYRQALEEWLGLRTEANTHTALGYRQLADRLFTAWLDRDVASITKTDVNAMVVTLKTQGGRDGRGLKDSTVRQTLMVPKAVFGWLHDEGRIPTNPIALAKPKLAKTAKRRRFLTHREFDAMMARAGADVAPMLQVMTDAGLRAGEVLGLQVQYVDLAAGTITVAGAMGFRDNGYTRELTTTKTGDFTTLPVSAATLAMLAPLVRNQDPLAFVFRKANGTSWSYAWLRKQIVTLAADAKLGRSVTPHDFRHTCAVWMLQAGVGLERVQDRLRHANIGVTRKEYGSVLPKGDQVTRDALSRLFDGNGGNPLRVVA